ncbi:hypothetical protein CPB86DRAFT_797414 [Serendipita vermifera]|nr:hypothetical protein CPB86DRAFT_797414 [Serendipita vermifera]
MRKMARAFLQVPRPLDISNLTKIPEHLGGSTRLQPSGSSRYVAKDLFCFIQQCVIVVINPQLKECPLEILAQTSSPLWAALHPREILEWENLAKILQQEESTTNGSGAAICVDDVAFWEKLRDLSSDSNHEPPIAMATTSEAQNIESSTNLASTSPQHGPISRVNGYRTIHDLPEEMLQEILAFATCADFDEFAHDSTFEPVPSRGLSPNYISADIIWVFEDRLSVVLVCKSWYKLGLRFLYSHLRLDISWWNHNRDQFTKLLSREPTLCSYIIRLDLSESSDEFDESDPFDEPTTPDTTDSKRDFRQFIKTHLFPHLTNLRLLCSNYTLASGDYPIYPAIVNLSEEGKGLMVWGPPDYYWDGASHFWRNARVLELDLEYCGFSDDSSSFRSVSLPRLEQLVLKESTDPGIMNQIGASWTAPNLHTLILYFSHVEFSIGSISWASKTLVNLLLASEYFVGNTLVEFPVLQTLVIQQCFTKGWREFVFAPALKTIAFEDGVMDGFYKRDRDKFARQIADTLTRYPLCNSITFYRVHHVDREFSFDPSDKIQYAEAIKKQWVLPASEAGSKQWSDGI